MGDDVPTSEKVDDKPRAMVVRESSSRILPSRVWKWFTLERQTYFAVGLLVSKLVADYELSILITFLTAIWQEKLIDAVRITNIQDGAAEILKLPLAFVTKVLIGDSMMLSVSAHAYATGLCLLASSFPQHTRADRMACETKGICSRESFGISFYVALVLLTLGKPAMDLSLKGFEPQKTTTEGNTSATNLCQWIWQQLITWYRQLFMIYGQWQTIKTVGIIFASLALPYLVLGWYLRFQIPVFMMAVSLIFFWLGFICYTPRAPHEPANFRCCDTASDSEKSKTSVCLLLCLSVKFFMYGVTKALGKTYFIEQGNGMDAQLGRINNFPLQFFFLISDQVASPVVSKFYRKISGDRFNTVLSHLIKIGLGMVLSLLCCLTAAWVEFRKLRVIREYHFLENPSSYIVPMTIFWLTPQFFLLGAMDGLTRDSIKGLFIKHGPNLFNGYEEEVPNLFVGCGTMLSMVFHFLTRKVATKFFRESYKITDTVDSSRLGYFYYALSILVALNLVLFVIIAAIYYKKSLPQKQEEHTDVYP